MNIADGERIRTVLSEIGFARTDDEHQAHLLGIVACSVRQKAIDRVYTKIHQWNAWKQSKQLITFASGCILPADKTKFLKQFDLVFAIQELPRLPEFITQYGVPLPQSYQIPTIVSGTAANNTDDIRTDTNTEIGAPTATAAVRVDTNARTETSAPRTTGAVRTDMEVCTPTADAARTNTETHTSTEASATAAVRAKSNAARATIPMPGAHHAATAIKRRTTAEYLSVTPQYGSQFEAYVPIQNGCDKFCTFCAVPYTRGREVSRPSDEIMHEIKELIARDYKTITLLGQNVNSYGQDKGGAELSFAQLLERIAIMVEKSQKKRWIYFTSPHPKDFNTEVFSIMAQYSAIAKQVHLPLQSGDDKVLIKMNRKHSMQRYTDLVNMVRMHLPSATLFTDIIVGFCGETEAQFNNTRQAMRDFQYNMAYIAQYSPRPGAASARWKDDIAPDIKKRRYRELTLELHRSAFAHNTQLIGRVVDALVVAPDRKDGFLSVRTEGKIVMRFPSRNTELIGHIIPLEVTGVQGLSLEGKMCSSAGKYAHDT